MSLSSCGTSKLCNFGLVACFGEDLEAVLDELGGGAAEDCLLAEQVGFGLFGEGGLDDACAVAPRPFA